MPGLFDGTPLERPVTCELCHKPLPDCRCPRDATGRILPPSHQTATIRLEKRPGGKLVTLISGLDPHASDLPSLLKDLKTLCAAGGTVQNATIELQGDHRHPISAFLTQKGYRSKVR